MSFLLQLLLNNHSSGEVFLFFFIILLIFPWDLSKSVKLSYLREMPKLSGIFSFFCVCVHRIHTSSECISHWELEAIDDCFFPLCSSVFWRNVNDVFYHWQKRAVVLPDADTLFSSWVCRSSYLMFEEARSHMCSLAKKGKEKKKKQVKVEFSLKFWWNMRSRYQIPLTFGVFCAADYFPGGSLQVIHHVYVMENVAKPLYFISNSRGQRSGDFSQGCNRCSNSLKQCKHTVRPELPARFRSNCRELHNVHATLTRRRFMIWINVRFTLNSLEGDSAGLQRFNTAMITDRLQTTFKPPPPPIMNTHTKKWNAWNEIFPMYQQNFQPDVIAHVKQVVLLLRLGGVKQCSLYRSVRAGSVYISKISKANKVSTHDMRSSTAGIRRSTCWNKHVLVDASVTLAGCSRTTPELFFSFFSPSSYTTCSMLFYMFLVVRVLKSKMKWNEIKKKALLSQSSEVAHVLWCQIIKKKVSTELNNNLA